MRLITSMLIAMLFLGGCAVEEANQDISNAQVSAQVEDGKGFHAVLEQIHGAQMQMRPGSLCHTFKRHTGGAGLYRVVSIESFMEESEEPRQLHPKTYVKLERLESWSVDAPKDPVARINGGVYPSGVTGGFPVSLVVGEKVGLILDAPTPGNLGFYSLHSAGVFSDRGGDHYTNDRLFTKDGASLQHLAEIVSARADLPFDECRKNDVRTDIESPEEHFQDDMADKPVAPPVVHESEPTDTLAD